MIYKCSLFSPKTALSTSHCKPLFFNRLLYNKNPEIYVQLISHVSKMFAMSELIP